MEAQTVVQSVEVQGVHPNRIGGHPMDTPCRPVPFHDLCQSQSHPWIRQQWLHCDGGRYHGRACAIKRLPNATKRLDREITELQRVDRHEHVRRLYGHQQVGGYTYMALELADASLERIMQTSSPPSLPWIHCPSPCN